MTTDQSVVRESAGIERLRGPLWACAAAVALLAGAVMMRGEGGNDWPSLLPEASAQVQVPRAGGGGVYLMPGQLSSRMWGVYLMDIDRQSLMAYHYDPAERQLRLLAAREFTNDRLLGDFNTFPPPDEVARILELEQQNDRVVPLDETTQPAQ